jgi:hypothetical protein
MTHNDRPMPDEHEHVYDAEQSEAWRRVLTGELGQLKYIRAVLGRIRPARGASSAPLRSRHPVACSCGRSGSALPA